MGAAETPIRKPEGKPEPKKSMRERVDPKLRTNDGVDNAVRIARQDPNRSYVWANTLPVSTNAMGHVDFYLNMSRSMGLDEEDGYAVCRVSPDGVFAYGALSKNSGDPIENTWGQTLLSCPLEFKELVEELGSNLQSGQHEADRLEKLLISNRGLDDHMRGIGKRGWFRVQADPEHGQTETYLAQRERG